MARKKSEESTESAVETASAEKRDVFRMSDQGTIHFGKDDEGNAYGPENSPKKGENTKQRWAIYRDGMTVADALEAGLTRSNIRKDRRAGFITITNPEPAEAETAEAAE